MNPGKEPWNTQPGDGPKYIGRRLLHLTGRCNYREYGKLINEDLENNPEMVSSDFILAIKTACLYWKKRNINTYADKDNIKEVTYRVNGGYNGLYERHKILKKAKKKPGI